jgi:hypothetical protein
MLCYSCTVYLIYLTYFFEILVLYNAETQNDFWELNWKGYGRKWSCPGGIE